MLVLSSLSLACWASGGQLIAWGATWPQETNFPPMLTNVVALSADDGHKLLLLADGTVTNFGFFYFSDNHKANLFVPAGLSNVAAVAAGYGHDVVLRHDGSIRAWGRPENPIETNVPPSLTNAAAIAAGFHHSVALTAEGNVVPWGYHFYNYNITNVPEGLSRNVLKVAAGDYHQLALKADGTVAAWGQNGSGQLNIPPGLSDVVAISAGTWHSLALKSNGTVVAWGYNAYGQLNVPAGLDNVVAIWAGWDVSLAVRSNGRVVAWGGKLNGQTNVPPSVTNAAAVAGGRFNNVALVGDVAPRATSLPSSVTVPYGSRVLLSASVDGSKPLSYQWSFGRRALPGQTNIWLAVNNVSLNNAGIYTVISSNSFGTATNEYAINMIPLLIKTQPLSQSAFVNAAVEFKVGSAGIPPIHFQWMFNGTNLPGATNDTLLLPSPQLSDAGAYSVVVSNTFTTLVSSNAHLVMSPLGVISPPQDVSVRRGGDATFTVTAAGLLPLNYQWQFNGADLPGATTTSLALSNVQPPQTGIYAVRVTNPSGSVVSTDARLAVHEIATWGSNSKGQLNLPSINGIVAIAAGDSSSLALRQDGKVAAWGDNSSGQTNVSPSLGHVIAIAAGAFHNLALKRDGTVAAWGNNSFGQITVPAGLTNVVAIAGGDSHSLALTRDGKVYGWGRNVEGQIDIPFHVTNAVAIAAGRYHSMALQPDGTVSVWGDNSYGQTNVFVGLANAQAIACGLRHNIVLTGDGSVGGWGDNSYGQTDPPAALSNTVAIAAGFFHNIVVGADGSAVSWGNNNLGQANVPTGLSNVVAAACGRYHSLVLIGTAPLATRVLTVNPAWDRDRFSLQLPTRSGRVYLLQYKDALSDNDWTSLPLTAGDGGLITLTDPTASASTRFYRVREW